MIKMITNLRFEIKKRYIISSRIKIIKNVPIVSFQNLNFGIYFFFLKTHLQGKVVLNLFFGMFSGSFATLHGCLSPYKSV